MRLKQAAPGTQATAETTASAPQAHARAVLDAPPAHEAAAQTARLKEQRKSEAVAALPSRADSLKAAILGMVSGMLVCFNVFIYWGMFQEQARHSLHTLAINSEPFLLCVYLFLPMMLTFCLGWGQRNGIRGAVSGTLFGITLILSYSACFAVSAFLKPIEYIDSLIDSLHLVPYRALVFIVVMGAVGGTCGRAWQGMKVKSRKANR